MNSRFFFRTPIQLAAQYNSHKKEIVDHLKQLNISQEWIDHIIKNIDQLPAGYLKTYGSAMIDFLTKITPINSRCEPHYEHSQYLAEYFCTITNAGFFAVAYYYNDYATLLAGTFSALSHAIPLKFLNDLDKFFAKNVTLKVLYNYDLLLNYPKILMAGLVTLTFGGLDYAIRYGFLESLKEYGKVFHSGWHLSAGYALYQFNHSHTQALTVGGLENKITLSAPELIQYATSEIVPKFLQPYCKTIMDAVSGIAEKMYSLSYAAK